MPEKKFNLVNDTQNIFCQTKEEEHFNHNCPRYRLKFWEIENYLTCPVIGMCLTLNEQKQLLKKTRFTVHKATFFEIHEALVSSANSENKISKRVDYKLERKFEQELSEFFQLKREEFLIQCKKAFERGEHKAALWAAAAHPDLPDAYRREIFGKIHMTMHFNAEEKMQLNKKISLLQEKLEAAKHTASELGQSKRSLQKENNRLLQAQKDLQDKALAAENEKIYLQQEIARSDLRQKNAKLEHENLVLQEKSAKLEEQLQEQMQRVKTLTQRNTQLSSELIHNREMNMQFKQKTLKIMQQTLPKNCCEPDCPAYDLCQKRILVVGGISRMENLYRELVENSGGIFEYHNGCVKKGVKQLDSCLKRADLVLCPVNINSHTACSVVKNLAKKYNKTVHMLENSSLNTFSQVIWGNETKRGKLN